MGRLFCMFLCCAMLAQPDGRVQREAHTQPVFFSMIFPQLVPAQWLPVEESGARQL